MTMELKYSQEANNGHYWVNYYCYNDKCPARTKEKPWPRSDGKQKWVQCISKKGNPYKRKRWICKHCGEEMQGVINVMILHKLNDL